MLKRIVLFASLSTVLIAGCVADGSTTDSDSLYITASALTKLSASVESTVRYKNPPDNIPDEDLLKLATEHDPSLMAPFSGYTVKVLREDRHAVVLVCSEDGALGLLEDVGCTAAMDKHLWQVEGSDCSFTLSPSSACAP
ncbi:hypothetical protein CVT91_05610 [Candidatus Atribacteria bacterium HGW-Atribacteria-1]|nr:MAG: hypothetical protein CVT91_05610 [Candidatus Atribacteria bacterium HGW-Atribacteria-1]